MSKTLIAAGLAATLATLAAPAAADRALDDLAAVKKAVGSPHDHDAEARQPKARSSGRELRWFHLRVVEKGEKHARVSLKLPLALVRAAGEDWRLPGCDECRHSGLTLGEVLRTLRRGESLLEIDDDDAVVRIWVE